jgi:hypothetical protein
MTCYKTIQNPSTTIEHTTRNEKRVIINTDSGDIELVINIYETHFFYLTINVNINFLSHEPTRFFVFNRSEGYIEEPIGNGFLLFKEFQYEIYDRDEMILSLNPSTTITMT